MPYFLNMQETSTRFGYPIDRIRCLLGQHDVEYGSAGNYIAFAAKLDQDYQLRIELSALVKQLSVLEGGDFLLTDMMSVIAAAVGGMEIGETAADITKASDTIMAFLIGTGCWSHFGAPPSEPETLQGHNIRAEVPGVFQPGSATNAILRNGSTAPSSFVEAQLPSEWVGSTDFSAQISATLARLETNYEQTKKCLDLMEKRIQAIDRSRATFELSNVSFASDLSRAPTPITTSGLDAARKTSTPAEPVLKVPRPDLLGQRHLRLPGIAFVTLLLLMLALALPYWKSDSASVVGPSPIITPVPTKPTTEAVSGTVSRVLPETNLRRQKQQKLVENHRELPQSGSAASLPLSTARSAHVRTRIASNVDTSKKSDPEVSGRTLQVPSAAMQRNLISAPPPSYPALARVAHIQGKVEIAATISKTGSITNVEVLSGPHALRQAAADAVRTWQYKPYSVDGHPVSVDTVVSVDFSLKHSKTSVEEQ